MHRLCLSAWLFAAAAACGKETASAPTAPTAAMTTSSPETDAESTEGEAAVVGREGDPDEISPANASPSAGTSSGSAGLHAEALRVLETMTASSYSHHTHVIGTTYEVDCSGFVDLLLARVEPAALAELRAATVKRPLAKHFVQFLDTSAPKKAFQRVTRIQELQPGDIIAWDKPEDVVSTNTGHVMLVNAAPEQRNASSWAVPIMDSSAAPHGKGDSRQDAKSTGIGRGAVVLEADASGAPVAYHWTEARSSRRHATKIVLGRVL